jgi:hypothetical protein
MGGQGMNEDASTEWVEQLREIILTYNTNRISDPFMAWFREHDHANAFRNQFKRILIILIAARFDHQTTPENALKNTIRVYNAGILSRLASLPVDEMPLLIPRHPLNSREWTELFAAAIPQLYRLAHKINKKTEWSAHELLTVMRSTTYSVPYLGINTSRLAVRWLYELIPALQIQMSNYKIPIDGVVYRVTARLGIISPQTDKYSGDNSPADRKIQSLATRLFPDNPWCLVEALWSTGRRAARGGHCYPAYPNHSGCMFEAICPKLSVDMDPSTIGIDVDGRTRTRRLTTIQETVMTERARVKGTGRISAVDWREYRDLWLHALTTDRKRLLKKL